MLVAIATIFMRGISCERPEPLGEVADHEAVVDMDCRGWAVWSWERLTVASLIGRFMRLTYPLVQG
jgi:hypothetical protein